MTSIGFAPAADANGERVQALPRRLVALTSLGLVLALSACGKALVHGRYYRGGEWLEFRNGLLYHGMSGDAIRYRLDGRTIAITSPGGSVEGEVVSSTTVRFDEGAGTMAGVFTGVWVAPATPSATEDAEARTDVTPILGRWRIHGETDVFELRPDGTYTWGPRIRGSYQVLPGRQVRVTLVEASRTVGRLDYSYEVERDRLTLTLADGSVTTYERVE